MHEKAREFAVAAHGDQLYGESPYSSHLDAVVQLLHAYGDEAKAIGYLHDVLENTDVDFQTIESKFGAIVARCVALLTDESEGNRRERKDKTYGRLAKVMGEEEVALVVSAADRLANLQACIADANVKLLKMYWPEHSKFRKAVYREGLCEDLWAQIEAAISAATWILDLVSAVEEARQKGR